MSNCFDVTRNDIPCDNCKRTINAFDSYVWYDVGRGSNWCMTCYKNGELPSLKLSPQVLEVQNFV